MDLAALHVPENYRLEISHGRCRDRDHGHDAFCHGHPDADLSRLCECPFEVRLSFHRTHGFRAYRPRGSRGHVPVLTVQAVACPVGDLDARSGYRGRSSST
jgi:hypothetical protein